MRLKPKRILSELTGTVGPKVLGLRGTHDKSTVKQ